VTAAVHEAPAGESEGVHRNLLVEVDASDAAWVWVGPPPIEVPWIACRQPPQRVGAGSGRTGGESLCWWTQRGQGRRDCAWDTAEVT